MFEDINQQNAETGSQYQTNSFNDTNPGGLWPDGFTNISDNYFSPWDIGFNRGAAYVNKQPSYIFENGDGGVDGNYSPYTLEVYAWIGLAYFDGVNDGVLTNPLTTPPTPIVSMAANPGQYPNLYTFNAGIHQEVGNLIRTASPLRFLPAEATRIEDINDHLPTMNPSNPKYPAPQAWTHTQGASGFDIVGAVLPQEEALLKEYGKVFFYEVDVFEAGAFVGKYYLHPEIHTLNDGSTPWQKVEDTPGGTQQQANVPFGSFDLYYYTDGSSNQTSYSSGSGGSGTCNSFEVIVDRQNINHTEPILGGSVSKTLVMDFLLHHITFWQNSALSLKVE
ncbi:hypothetical protein SAMN05421741_10525 [Paenimyroides ummariense]|uniref:Uncharacterized protein n=1 Tax=Paenimyroides ummariense TaxID=913024 RepID=A0A1I4YRZ3_9FLAO|nr:hypothetical protein [Paenimyroides ummariense]SFN40776.1 hypothetical protein SAMN05421741_10525 [Paenimyroides ummariense]